MKELTEEQIKQQRELCKALLAIFRKGYNKALDHVLELSPELQAYVDIQKTTSIKLPNDEMWKLIEVFVEKYKEYDTVKIEILPK